MVGHVFVVPPSAFVDPVFLPVFGLPVSSGSLLHVLVTVLADGDESLPSLGGPLLGADPLQKGLVELDPHGLVPVFGLGPERVPVDGGVAH